MGLKKWLGLQHLKIPLLTAIVAERGDLMLWDPPNIAALPNRKVVKFAYRKWETFWIFKYIIKVTNGNVQCKTLAYPCQGSSREIISWSSKNHHKMGSFLRITWWSYDLYIYLWPYDLYQIPSAFMSTNLWPTWWTKTSSFVSSRLMNP